MPAESTGEFVTLGNPEQPQRVIQTSEPIAAAKPCGQPRAGGILIDCDIMRAGPAPKTFMPSSDQSHGLITHRPGRTRYDRLAPCHAHSLRLRPLSADSQ
jgi:hypothetical protein